LINLIIAHSFETVAKAGRQGPKCNTRDPSPQYRALLARARQVLAKLNDCEDFLDSVDFPDDNENRPRSSARRLRWWVEVFKTKAQGRKRSMSRFAASLVVLALAGGLTGCHVIETPYVSDCHHAGWDPVFGSCGTCGTCGGICEGHTPASYIGHQLMCAGGCGEIYWGPWLSDPPDACDPCDDCGNWVGERCCPPKLRHHLLAGLFGGYHNDWHGGKGKIGKGGDVIYEGELIHERTEPPTGQIEEVLPPTPDPIRPAASLRDEPAAGRSPFRIRSVRFER
jgi:hypothetical protein